MCPIQGVSVNESIVLYRYDNIPDANGPFSDNFLTKCSLPNGKDHMWL